MNTLKIKAILFDLGKVILDFDFDPAFRKLSRQTSLEPDNIRDFFYRSGLEVLYDGGKISSLKFYREVKTAFKHRLDYAQFKKLWNEIFTPKQETIRLIRRLRPHYRLVMVSNTNAMHFDYIRKKYAFIKYFDQIILSFKERSRKPDDRIYKIAVKACHAKPGEIFYIDDRQEMTAAASELGLHTFTFKNNYNALRKKMKSLRILGLSR